jgi:hypothetical protein
MRDKAPTPGSDPAHPTRFGAGLRLALFGWLEKLTDRSSFRVQQTHPGVTPNALPALSPSQGCPGYSL